MPALEQPRIGRPPEVTVVDVPRMLERYDPSNERPAATVGVKSAIVCRWRCPDGPDHVYETRADAVFNSPRSACPFCAGRKPSVTNRLDVLYPEIAAEWDAERNDGPPAVVATSSKNAWWRCAVCDHQWTTRVGRRTKEKTGCPKCAGTANAARMAGTSWSREPQVSIAKIPHMAARYAPENELPAEKVAARSIKIRRWRCPEGPDHLYEAQPATVRDSPTGGCPFCAGRELSVTNSLETLHPEIAAEWDTERNGGPPAVVATSSQVVWWRCKMCDHWWEKAVSSRTVRGAGCPQCSRRKSAAASLLPRPGRSLAEVAPEVAATWHPTKNAPLRTEDVPAMSNTPRWWQCEEGHEWETAPAHRAGKRASGCPFCAGFRVTPETSLAARYPEIAAEWHPTLNGELTPEMVMPKTDMKVWWRCPAGHDYDSLLGNRTGNGNGCTYCAGLRIGYGNDLASRAPDVAAEWDYEKNYPVKPAEVTTGGAAKYWWLCEQGHSWETTVPSRVRLGTGCPQCWSGWRRSHPEIALEYELERVLPARVSGDTEVRTSTGVWHADVLCAQLRIVVEYDGSFWHRDNLERDLRKTQDLVAEGWLVVRVRQAPLPMIGPWDVACEPKDPDTFAMTVRVLDSILAAVGAAPDSHPARGQISLLRKRIDAYKTGGTALAVDEAKQALIEGRIHRPRPTSSGLPRPLKPGQSLAEKSPEIAAEWHPELNGDLTPSDVANSRNAKAWWRCSLCGKDWEASINHRTKNRSLGCPDCAHARVSIPESGQSLADLYPEIAAEWHPARNHPKGPGDVRPGSNLRVWWQCSLCGKDWETAVTTRMRRKTVGCPNCGWSRRSANQTIPKPGQTLADLFPEVAAQWHPLRNLPKGAGDVKPRSSLRAWWRCEEGHEWQTRVSERTKKQPTGCPYCYQIRRSDPRSAPPMDTA